MAANRGVGGALSLWESTAKSSIKSMAIIQRHGARSPVYNCMLGSPLEQVARERDTWASLVRPPEEGAPGGSDAGGRFPVLGSRLLLDDADHVWPWGRLTHLGADQMKSLASFLASNYSDFFRNRVHSDKTVYVKASNYGRTQLSAQILLDTLIPDHHAVAIDTDPHQECDIAVFPSKPRIANIARDVFSSHKAILSSASEREALCLKLQSHVPCFMSPQPVADEAGDATSSGGGTGAERAFFTWIRAGDYFACNAAHGLDLISPLTHDEDGALTFSFLLTRFNALFDDEEALALGAGGLGRQVCACLRAGAEGDTVADSVATHDERGPVPHLSVFSGHDMTLIPLLRVLGQESEDPVHGLPFVWPGYASSLVLSLVKREPADGRAPTGAAAAAAARAGAEFGSSWEVRWELWDPNAYPGPSSPGSPTHAGIVPLDRLEARMEGFRSLE